MPRPFVFSSDTRLWHASEGWRMFPRGETDPGGAWHDVEGGRALTSNTEAGILKDLIEANDRIEQLGQAMGRKDFDLAMMGKREEEALAKVAGLEQDKRDLQAKLDEMTGVAREVTAERDRLVMVLRGAGQGAPIAQLAPTPIFGEALPPFIPADWEALPFLAKKSLAMKVAGPGAKIVNKADVHGAIRAHLGELTPA